MKLCWNVYYDNVNTNEIIPFNVFDHASYAAEVKQAAAQATSKEQFTTKLRAISAYYFWSKAEYEIVLTSWPPYITRMEAIKIRDSELPKYRMPVDLETEGKIDVYSQLHMNWDVFVDYCWKSCHAEKVRVKTIYKGRWIVGKDYGDSYGCDCSKCGAAVVFLKDQPSSYCPNCGSPMSSKVQKEK